MRNALPFSASARNVPLLTNNFDSGSVLTSRACGRRLHSCREGTTKKSRSYDCSVLTRDDSRVPPKPGEGRVRVQVFVARSEIVVPDWQNQTEEGFAWKKLHPIGFRALLDAEPQAT